MQTETWHLTIKSNLWLKKTLSPSQSALPLLSLLLYTSSCYFVEQISVYTLQSFTSSYDLDNGSIVTPLNSRKLKIFLLKDKLNSLNIFFYWNMYNLKFIPGSFILSLGNANLNYTCRGTFSETFQCRIY